MQDISILQTSSGTKTNFSNFFRLLILFFPRCSSKGPLRDRVPDVEVKPSDTIEEVKVPCDHHKEQDDSMIWYYQISQIPLEKNGMGLWL